MCQKLCVSASGFYAYEARVKKVKNPPSLLLVSKIKAIHAASRRVYGSPRVHQSLRRDGHQVSCKRVARLMRDHGLVGRTRRRRVKTTISGATAQCAPNILDRAFYADGPDKKWVTDITYLPTQEGWLYLAAIIDLFSRKVVGYAMANNMEVGLATRALQRAIGTRRPLKGTLHHSDQGSQFTSNLGSIRKCNSQP